MNRLNYHTVTPRLLDTLRSLMADTLFSPFRLVGGTNLALRFGHRMSDDIDLFTDADYDSLYFKDFENFLKQRYAYFDTTASGSLVGMGRCYYIGDSEDDCIKLDLMYMTDPFVHPSETIEGIRMASVEDILAMKVDVVCRGGRKKDFWDLHLLHDTYSIPQMLQAHGEMYKWTHSDQEAIACFKDFSVANEDPDPRCMLDKDWDIIRLDFIDWLRDDFR